MSTHDHFSLLKFTVTYNIIQEGKKFWILNQVGSKTQLEVWGHCEPLTGFSGGGGTRDKALGKFTKFILKGV